MSYLKGFLFFSILFFSCGQSKEKLPTDMVNIPATSDEGLDKSSLPVITFEEEVYDFGAITQGEKVAHEFKFKNTGESDLIISNAYADCGCTVAEVPKQPIVAGKSNVIRVTFDSSNKTGVINKAITVVTNCMPNKHAVKIKASIIVPKPKTN
jgi:hypothetical protein